MSKYIFLTGGVTSSLGKGLTSASLAALLQAHGYTVRTRKIDPYLNIDTKLMSPGQHGETFVTEDGKEVDLDFGHYERFTGIAQSGNNCTTMGSIYNDILTKERNFGYDGATVQIIPHVTDTIQDFICQDPKDDKPDFVITEIGGTTGDIEGLPCLEAIRQLRNKLGKENTMFVHITLVPKVPSVGDQAEFKTKPTQHSVKELRSIGIQPDAVLCRFRSDTGRLTDKEINKISLFCSVEHDAVIEVPDVDVIYKLPLILHDHDLDKQVFSFFKMTSKSKTPNLKKWVDFVRKVQDLEKIITIGIVGKYCTTDAYLCVVESLKHAGVEVGVKVKVRWVDAEKVENGDKEEEKKLEGLDGYIIPGGFGNRGVEGKIKAATLARTNKKPLLGICLGMQIMVIEFARNVLGYDKANSTEFDPKTAYPVIYKAVEEMRLGKRKTELVLDSKIATTYGKEVCNERHRHRYSVDINLADDLRSKGMLCSGYSYEKDVKLVNAVELQDHPWYVGVQFHPEMKSTPFKPRPLFLGLVRAAVSQQGK